MSKCCVDCRQFVGVAGVAADGIYKRDVRDGAIVWMGVDGIQVTDPTLIDALDAGYATAPIADCSLFEGQISAEPRYQLFEEITTATGQPTGVLVEARTAADGTVTYTNLNTGAVYDPAADPATSLTVTEDADYEMRPTLGCDEGVNIERHTWYQVGNETAISTSVIDLSTGAAHTLSGNETWGAYCSAGTVFSDPKILCAKVRDASGNVVAGTPTTLVAQVIEQDAATGAFVGMTLYDETGAVVVEGAAAGEYYVERGCC